MKIVKRLQFEANGSFEARHLGRSRSSIHRWFAAALLAGMTAPLAAYAEDATSIGHTSNWDAPYGQDATWVGNTGNWDTPRNWSPAIPPLGTAIFGASDTTTITFDRSFNQVNTLLFAVGAPRYTFKIGGRFRSSSLIIDDGIVNHSSSAPRFALLGAGSELTFVDFSAAGDARIKVSGGDELEFFDRSTAAQAVVGNAGLFDFSDHSSAGRAQIANTGDLQFFDSSTARDASIVNKGTLSFYDSSTAGHATIVTKNGGETDFFDHAAGARARFVVNAGGAFDISGLATPGMAAGSIAGAGNFFLGSKSLTEGGNNISTEVRGVVADGGLSGGVGGSLIKVGSGTLILSGRNTYTGGTTISAGTLQLGDGGRGGSIIGNMVDDGSFAVDRSNTITYRGVISGTGGFQQNGSGTTILTGRSTYRGGTTISAGTLQLGNGGRGGSIVGDMVDDGGFAVDRSNTLTYRGVISGTGGFQQNGSGTTILTGSSTYGGGTTISAGTLRLGNGGASGSIAGNVVDNGSFAVDRSDILTYRGVISGTGGFRQLGAGTTILTGSSTYGGGTTISAGTLQLGDGGASGSIAGNVVDNGSFAVDRSDTFTYGGVISGTGGFRQLGAGTTILTATSSFTGPTTIDAGTLGVDGSLISPVLVNSGGTLIGNGTVGGITVASGGKVAPGNSIGTLSVNGNVSFAAGSTYSVAADAAGQAGRIAATGKASLTGGTVQVLAAPGKYASATSYPILTAGGGVTGSFAGATSNRAILIPSLSNDANDVFLTLTRNPSYFSAMAETPNQSAVGRSLDTSPLDSGLVQAAAPPTGGQAPQALGALSGDIYGSLQSILVDDARYMRQALLGRLRTAPYADETGPMASLAFGGPMTAFASDAGPQIASLPASDGPLAPPLMMPGAAVRGAGSDLIFWGQGFGAWGRLQGNGNAAGVSDDLGGFVTGVDRRFGENWRAGLAAGYSGSSVTGDAGASSAGLNTGWIGAYAGGKFGAWTLRGGSAFGWSGINATRAVSFPGFADQETAGYGGRTAQAFGELGYGVAVDAIAFEPFGGLAYVHLNTASFAESGGAAALSGTGDAESVGYSTLGLRAATKMPLANGMTVIPRVSVAWQHAFGDIVPTAALGFESTGAGFTTAGVPIARDSALVNVGFDVAVGRQTTLGLYYDGQIGGSAWDDAVEGRLTWRF